MRLDYGSATGRPGPDGRVGLLPVRHAGTFFPEAVSRAAVVPVAVCLAFQTFGDYVAYNAEQPAIFVLVRRRTSVPGLSGEPAWSRVGPWPSACRSAWCRSSSFRRARRVDPRRGGPRLSGVRFAAACAAYWPPASHWPPAPFAGALLGLYLWRQGLWSHFAISYLISNVAYAGRNGGGFVDEGGRVPRMDGAVPRRWPSCSSTTS